MTSRTVWETVEAKGTAVVDKVKELIAEGNVRRVRVRQRDRVLAEFPLTIGVAGVVLAPIFAALAALAALVTECTFDIEREEPGPRQDLTPKP
jgi:hypothetical protein